MTEYERSVFRGKCPYMSEPCTDKIPCVRCRTNEAEKELMQKLDEQEEIYYEQLQEEIYYDQFREDIDNGG